MVTLFLASPFLATEPTFLAGCAPIPHCSPTTHQGAVSNGGQKGVSCSVVSDCNPRDCQAPLSMGFPRQEILEWIAISFSGGFLPDPGIEPGFAALKADSLPSEPPGKPINFPAKTDPWSPLNYTLPTPNRSDSPRSTWDERGKGFPVIPGPGARMVEDGEQDCAGVGGVELQSPVWVC